MNMVLLSGVKAMPVTSHSFGPVRKRRISLLAGSAHSIWLLPWPSYSPLLLYFPSVCIHRRPSLSNASPSGLLNILSAVMLAEPELKLLRSVYLTGLPASTKISHSKRVAAASPAASRSEENTSELQSLLRRSYAGFCLTQ